jgi:hypothetical protein
MYLPHNPYFQIGFIEIVMNKKAEDKSGNPRETTLHITNH